jgi:small-conductance mechanosensitive channel
MPHYFFTLIYSLVVIFCAWLAKKFILDKIISGFADRLKIEAYVVNPVKKFFAVIIYLIAVFILVGIWGLKGTLTGLLAGAGVAGIVIGIAVKDIVSDLFAGIILFFDRPFKIGDAIVIENMGGQVLDIGLRSTKVKTWDGVFVVIPNSKVYSGIIKNYTNYNCGRLEVAVGVDYESKLNKVQKAINQALSREDMPILKDPEPIVAIDTLSGSSINFKVLFWYNYDVGIPWITLKGKIMQAILEEFRKQGLTIPSSPITISSREDSTLPRI